MNITHLNATDNTGGAGRAAYRLHRGLERLGLDSRMLVLNKSEPADNISAYKPSRATPERVRRRLLTKLNLASRSWRPKGADSLEVFSSGLSKWGSNLLTQIDRADIVNLHWVVGMFDYCHLQNIKAKLVWTLHDMHPFTGGCHFNENCERFTNSCGHCPELSSTRQKDLSQKLWQQRFTGLTHLSDDQLTIVTPSKWLARQSQASSLFGRFRHEVIPNGLDIDVFRPRDQRCAREVLGIPQGARVILFVADSINNRRKGMDLLLQSMRQVDDIANCHLLAIGGGILDATLPVPITVVPTVRDDRFLSFVYSAADVFVIPSRQDNLPNTVLEALSCGTPVVGFDVGGIPDMVVHGETGFTAPFGDIEAMSKFIQMILTDPALQLKLSQQARHRAETSYGLDVQAKRYAILYEQLVRNIFSRERFSETVARAEKQVEFTSH